MGNSLKFENLTDEQKAKLLACKSSKALMSQTQEMGIELTPEQLESVSGGAWLDPPDEEDRTPAC